MVYFLSAEGLMVRNMSVLNQGRGKVLCLEDEMATYVPFSREWDCYPKKFQGSGATG